MAALLVLGLAVLPGCPQPTSNVTLAVHPDYPALTPRSVAVLPFDNMSPDLDATPLIRPIVAERLRFKGYQVPPLPEMDGRLQEAGVLISHDVYSFTPLELGEILGVDAVMFGTVTDFTTQYAVIYSQVSVQLRLELVDCRSGEILWQNEERAFRNTFFQSLLTFLMFEKPEQAIAVVAAQNAIFAALESLHPYAEEAAKSALAPLPPGPLGEKTYPWDRDPHAFDRSSTRDLIYFSPIATVPFEDNN